MLNTANPIHWLKANGSSFDIGSQMGQQGREAVHTHLIESEIWATITSDRHAEQVTGLLENVNTLFPDIIEELLGLADGLQLPFTDVAAWNFRGDIKTSVPDGCTTIQAPGPDIKLSHNEDGLPFFRGHCFILDAQPAATVGFRAFCYPGSLAGHTFGWNDAGLVQTVNNLRLQDVDAAVGRMVLGRAVLNSTTLDGAIEVLSANRNSGGFHMTLAQVGNPKLMSIEYGAGQFSAIEITDRTAHSNHALHLQDVTQIVTQSSGDRQARCDHLVREDIVGDLEILRDNKGPRLPVRRDDPQDPDNENTLATCVFNVSNTGVEWRIYGEKDGQPEHEGQSETS
ncbi:MAG: C45 family peptidase [Tateyamaria sp.]|uniref:C45 family autoproteolytic acyltransferase/hydolase n=1 Tax=Tateyamaria sp. TaxID=1929288 RepID=UPI00329E4B6A